MSLRAVIGAGPANTKPFFRGGPRAHSCGCGWRWSPAETLERGLKSRPSDPALAGAFERALDGLVEDYASSDTPLRRRLSSKRSVLEASMASRGAWMVATCRRMVGGS